jgi:UDP-glucose 4-epimerase
MLLEGHRPTIRGAADEVRDHLFIDDVVRANICCLARGQNQTLHISSGQGYTLKDLYASAAHALKSELEPLYISNSLVEAASCVLDNTLALHILGWHPEIDLTTGVQRTIENLRVEAQVVAPSVTTPLVIASSLVGVR